MLRRSIWKYEVPITDHFSVPMQRGAHVLTAQMQRDTLVLWAEVDVQVDTEPRHFYVIGTGRPLPLKVLYVSTVQDGQFVWHIYEDISGTQGAA